MSPSASTSFASTSMASTVPDSEADLNFSGADPDIEVEHVVPRIIHELEGEEGITTNLRVDFKERQRKRLFESIIVVLPPDKRSCTEEPHKAPVPDTSSMPMPLIDAAGPNNVPVVKSPDRKYVCPAQDEVSTDLAPVGDDLDRKYAPAPPCAPSWEEMMELLNRVPCFTKVEPLSIKMLEFFSLTKRISMNIDGNPPISIAARLPFGTPESVVSRIQPMQDYIAQETTEVVSLAPSLV